MRQRIARTFLVLAVSAAAASAAAEERLPDRRAVAAKPAAEAAARSTLLDLLSQLEELQTEVRQLRNTVEVQGHELEQLKGRQRSLYDDLDKRLRDAAFELMKQGLYDRAVKAFRAFLAKYPDSGLADNAQYWIAEGNYVLRNYKLALEEFTKVLNAPQSPKAPDALLKIGYVHYELGAYDKARKTLAEVQERYPGTSVAKLAAGRLDKMKKEGH